MKTIVTGGAGFIGSNATNRYLKRGDHVVVVDNLARDGVQNNLEWLRTQGSLEFHQLDVRDGETLARLFGKHRDADRVLHLAAQVAVTTSVSAPREDFEINALGTFNVLEAMRQASVAIRRRFLTLCHMSLLEQIRRASMVRSMAETLKAPVFPSPSPSRTMREKASLT